MLESQAIQAVTSVRARAREGVCLADDPDKILAAGFAAGHPEALERAVALYQSRVARLAWRLLGWRGDVDDLVQDVFLAAYENRRKLRGDKGLWPWLMKITLHRCRSHRRRNLLKLRWLWSRDSVEPVARPDILIEQDERAERVRSAVRELPARDREVVVLYYLEQRPVSEISALLRCSVGAIDVRLHRARKRLKGLLGDLDVG